MEGGTLERVGLRRCATFRLFFKLLVGPTLRPTLPGQKKQDSEEKNDTDRNTYFMGWKRTLSNPLFQENPLLEKQVVKKNEKWSNKSSEKP